MLLGWFLGVGLRFAAVAGTMVPWKGWEAGGSGAGGFLVVGLQFAAVGGTGVGRENDFCLVIIMAEGFNNNLDRNVEGSLPARWSDCTPSSLAS